MAKKTTTSKRVVKVEAYGRPYLLHFQQHNRSPYKQPRAGYQLSSAGKCGFRVPRKHPLRSLAAEDASKIAYDAGLRRVKVYVKGPGAGRESAIRTIHNAGITVSEIVDITPMPHNGCRPKARRKV